MTVPGPARDGIVEVQPEVVFLFDVLRQLGDGRLTIPRFQRPFVWRRDQMLDLLDSVYRQYPIGSILIWETDEKLATLDRIGPFPTHAQGPGIVGYVLDGHQRLSTLLAALVHHESTGGNDVLDDDPGRWNLAFDLEGEGIPFVHYQSAGVVNHRFFPLTSLLDTFRFLEGVDKVREKYGDVPAAAESQVRRITAVARAFQNYRLPVTRIRYTDLSQAVEIFARLNSKGQTMSVDAMVSALTYRAGGPGEGSFDLAYEIDVIETSLSERGFQTDRTTILRAALANIDEDIYRTNWTNFSKSTKDDRVVGLKAIIGRTRESLHLSLIHI